MSSRIVAKEWLHVVDDECPIVFDEDTRMTGPRIVSKTLARFIHDDSLILPVHRVLRAIDGQPFVRIGDDPEPALPIEGESSLLISMSRHIDTIDIAFGQAEQFPIV